VAGHPALPGDIALALAATSGKGGPRDAHGDDVKAPLVTVIIPSYNMAHFVGEAIDSVLKQTYPHFEIIVIDDGSTDTTGGAVRLFQDPRIRYVYQDNRGLSAARNTGLRLAKGDYIAFLDADDRFLSNKLELQVDFLETHPDVGLVVGGMERVAMNGRTYYRERPRSGHVPVERLLWGGDFVVHATLMRKEWTDITGFFDESLQAAEDWDFYLRMALFGCRIERIPAIVCVYRYTASSMYEDVERQVREMSRVIEKNFCVPIMPESLVRLKVQALAWARIFGAIRSFCKGRNDEGIIHMQAAYRLSDVCFRDVRVIMNRTVIIGCMANVFSLRRLLVETLTHMPEPLTWHRSRAAAFSYDVLLNEWRKGRNLMLAGRVLSMFLDLLYLFPFKIVSLIEAKVRALPF
jgi:glycosyltransferase involved in cell wall biosynthesis